jgi:hypothetical protein
MPQYMLAVHTTTTGEPRQPMTEEEQRAGFALIERIEADMEAADAFVYSARLSEPSEAKVVRRGAGKPKSTDGPFLETKEHIGGFYLIEAATTEAALDWAARVSDAIGEAIEMRPIVGSRGK